MCVNCASLHEFFFVVGETSSKRARCVRRQAAKNGERGCVNFETPVYRGVRAQVRGGRLVQGGAGEGPDHRQEHGSATAAYQVRWGKLNWS